MEKQTLTGGINGWIRIEQYNPMVLHIWLRDNKTKKNIDCLITNEAIDFLQAFKNKLGYSITLRGAYASTGYFVADEYYLEFINPFKTRTKSMVPNIKL